MRYIRQTQMIHIAALSVLSTIILATMLMSQRYVICVASGLSEERNLRAAEMLDPESGAAEAVASALASDATTDRFTDGLQKAKSPGPWWVQEGLERRPASKRQPRLP